MLLNRIPEKTRNLFIYEFTKELIKNSKTKRTIELEESIQFEIKEKLESQEIKIPRIRPTRQLIQRPITKPLPRKPIPKKIPKTEPLPQNVQYIKPTPTKKEIELEKLNPLIQDPGVRLIECDGPDKYVIVKGSMGTQPTEVQLTKEEIEKTIQKFSELTKIPAEEGVFKVVYGNLIFSAIISKTIDTRFIIEKMQSMMPNKIY
jgi:hypothetical protein